MHIQLVLREIVDYDPQISSLKPGHPGLHRDSKLLYRLQEDELQVVFGPVFRVLHQLVGTEPPVQAWHQAGQQSFPPALHQDQGLCLALEGKGEPDLEKVSQTLSLFSVCLLCCKNVTQQHPHPDDSARL